MRHLPAVPDIANKVCPYCQMPLTSGDWPRKCPACDMPHHAECWAANGGCTTFGCSEMPHDAARRRLSVSALDIHLDGRDDPGPPRRRVTYAHEEADFSFVTAFLVALAIGIIILLSDILT